jgi:hypothetical protein
MPTKAPKTLYSPEWIKSQLKPVLDVVNPLLSELLQYGLTLFARCANLRAGDENGDENLPILFVYRHLLEMLDSVAIQIAECAPAPAALQLRAMFEALLTIEYITHDKNKTRERAMGYLYRMELKRRRFYLSQDPNTSEGAALQKFIAGDPFLQEWKGHDPAKVTELVAEIDKILQMPELQAIATEYKSLRKKMRDPDWYSLFGGPANIAQLAQALNRAASYRILYGEWSERTHSADAIDRILTHDESGRPYARSLRDVSELNTAIDFAMTFTIDASRLLVRHYFPADEINFAKWYAAEISSTWNKIPKIVISNASD